MEHATEKGLKVALAIDTPALGDTIAAIPTLRKISEAHDNKPITVFTSKPFLFEGHPLVDIALPLDQIDREEYFVHRTFMSLVGKSHDLDGESVEFRYSNMDFRQFHAVSLGFTLKESEMEIDLYIERERELPVKDYVIIHPTHTWPTRTWEQAKWQELIDRLNERGIPVVAIGRDSSEVGHFNTDKPVMPINIKLGVNLLNDPNNDPAELRWMMNHRAKAVVTMDSGILHIAGTTDVNIIQLGSSIDNKLRAPYRNGSQDYKYNFVAGGCGIFCSSNQKYNIQAHGSIQGVPPQVRCLEGKPTFECHPTVDQVFEATTKLYGMQTIPEKLERAYITHTTENYEQVTVNLVNSILAFSEQPIVVYTIDYTASHALQSIATCIRLDLGLPNLTENDFHNNEIGEVMYVNRSTYRTYKTLSAKIDCMLAACDFINEWVYLDGDCLANYNVDDLFDWCKEATEYPLATSGPQQYVLLVKDGKLIGNPFVDETGNEQTKDNKKCLEWPLMDYFGMDVNQRFNEYRTTNILAGSNKNKDFLFTWRMHKEVLPTKVDATKFMPFHEETIYNVMVWDRDNRGLDMVYVNVEGPETVKHFFNTTTDSDKFMSSFYKLPKDKEKIKVFHGEKREAEANLIIQEIEDYKMKSNKKTLLYLAPHLSTGGMPQFLLKRVEAMLEANEYNVHVLEYCQFSDAFLVQRNQITDLLGGNFHTIAGLNTIDDDHRTRRMIELIDEINPDLIHIEECTESFDSFNKLTEAGLEYLYDINKPWKVIETCHNIWFQGKDKLYNPDAYMFCTPYHPIANFKDNKIGSKWLSTYPIVDLKPTEDQKWNAKDELDMDPDKIHVLNVGLWTSGKNQGEGVAIARIAEETYPGQFHFHFVGNQASNFVKYWKPIMDSIPANVTVHHEKSNVSDYMMAADAFMFNSTWECNPLALREAISYGLPTYSRNLEQYLDMFTPYITSFTDDLTENATILLESLRGQKKITGDFVQPQAEFERFISEHLEAYTTILAQAATRVKESTTGQLVRLEYQDGLKLFPETGIPSGCAAQFWDGEDLVYTAENLKAGHWYGPTRKWHTEWRVLIKKEDNILEEQVWTLNEKECLVHFDSKSLGDTLAWMGQMEHFKKQHNLKKLLVRTHKNWLFNKDYYKANGIELIEDWSQRAEVQYNIGVYYSEKETWKRDEHKYDWRHVTLGKIASDRLGIPHKEKRPHLAREFCSRSVEKQKAIVIATQSTAQAKYWNHPTGWQDLVDHYRANDYRVLHSSKEGTELKGIEQLPEALERVAEAILSAELFIGISSGLSWFAWALGAKVVIISGFTDPYVEFEDAIYINNHQVCHGCWGNHTFDRGDWNWCPVWKGTGRQFECTKTITAEDVIKKIEDAK